MAPYPSTWYLDGWMVFVVVPISKKKQIGEIILDSLLLWNLQPNKKVMFCTHLKFGSLKKNINVKLHAKQIKNILTMQINYEYNFFRYCLRKSQGFHHKEWQYTYQEGRSSRQVNMRSFGRNRLKARTLSDLENKIFGKTL